MSVALNYLHRTFGHIDWVLTAALVPLIAAGLVTMHSFAGESYFFARQMIWVAIGVAFFFIFSFIDWRFLRRTWVVVTLFAITAGMLGLIFVFGEFVLGAQSRFDLGVFAFQPAEIAKVALIILLAKYFSRRHIEIANIRHILVSGVYAGIIALLVFLQPDFGSAIIIGLIWLGMVLVSGISNKHLLLILLTGLVGVMGLWFFGFEDYQKERIVTFLHPFTDIQGSGYNARQSMIAVGSGQVLGKGLGYGTQSRLEFLPEYETDFIFAAFAEEWGFVGVLLLFLLFAIVIWRLIDNAMHGASNFETLFAVGLAILFVTHITIHAGMNTGLLPVTGTTIPLLSYGGSHLITELAALGILMGMRRYRKAAHKEDTEREFVGV